VRFAYIDHNIADAILKKRAEPVRDIIEALELVPVYSDENIKEIQKTPEREEEFLGLFQSFNAMRIFEEIVDFKFTGKMLASDQNIFDRNAELKEDQDDEDTALDGLDIIRKYHGGVDNKSFQKTLSNPLIEQQRILEGALLDTENLDSETLTQIESSLSQIPNTLAQIKVFAEELEQSVSDDKALFEQMEEHIKQGPIHLNQIKPPNVLEQIWNLVGQYFGAPETTLEQFFGIGMDISGLNLGKRNQHIADVNSILNNLNMIGFNRDTNLADKQRFAASWSDADHSSYASHCFAFFCNDKCLRKKTIAVFEYLEIWVPIIQVSGKDVVIHTSWMKKST